jgi:hypothetical protein
MAAVVLMAPPLEANAPALLGNVVTTAKLVGVRHIVHDLAIEPFYGELF